MDSPCSIGRKGTRASMPEVLVDLGTTLVRTSLFSNDTFY